MKVAFAMTPWVLPGSTVELRARFARLVFLAYASERGYALVDKRLFIPEQWFSEEYRERRQKW